MEKLFDYAASRGVRIEYCDLSHLRRLGDFDSATKHIRLQVGMLHRLERSVLAHELAHEFYADEPSIFGGRSRRCEDRADEWAAHFLIDHDEYRLAEEKFADHTLWIAQELDVTERLVIAYERTLTRLGDIVYVHSKIGAGQWAAKLEVAI